MKAIRKGVYVRVKYNDDVLVLKVVKKVGDSFHTYAPITYLDGSVHNCSMSLPISSIIEVL